MFFPLFFLLFFRHKVVWCLRVPKKVRTFAHYKRTNNMKKAFLLLAMATISIVAMAQPRSVGARITYGLDFTYQHSISPSNAVTLDVGMFGLANGLEATVTYDWINPGNLTIPWDKKGTWNWFAGVGAGLDINLNRVPDNASKNILTTGSVGVAGRLGVEYQFWFPMQLYVDYRPVIGVRMGEFVKNEFSAAYNTSGLYSLAIGIRYAF